MNYDLKFLVVGNINVDHVIYVDRIPRIDEIVSNGKFEIYLGGKGANQAVALSKLGGISFLAGCVGEDDLGAFALKELRSKGVDTKYVCRSNSHTGVAIIIVDLKGNKVIAVAPGANKDVSTEQIVKALDSERSFKAVLTQLELDLDSIKRISSICKDRNIITVLTASPPKKLDEDILKLIDILVANVNEAIEISGYSIAGKLDSIQDVKEIIEILRSKGSNRIVITMGSKGSVIYDENSGIIKVPALKTDKVVDTTGAGDVFIAALVYSTAIGYGIYESALIASASAAIKIGHKGAQKGIPTIHEAIRFLELKGYKI